MLSQNNGVEGALAPLRFQPYSQSKISLHNQCPRKFKYKYILKLPESEQDKTALFKGVRIHNLLEHYPNKDMDQNEETEQIQNKFIESELGQKYLNENVLRTAQREIQIKLILTDEGLIPQDELKRKDLSFYGYVDYINVLEYQGRNILTLVDWKTGKLKDQKYQEYEQLLYYSIYFFKKYKVKEIRISFCYIEHFVENDLILKIENLKHYEEVLINGILKAEESVFEPNKSKLCDWCPYQDVCQKDLS